jgi:hypothetical protein
MHTADYASVERRMSRPIHCKKKKKGMNYFPYCTLFHQLMKFSFLFLNASFSPKADLAGFHINGWTTSVLRSKSKRIWKRMSQKFE